MNRKSLEAAQLLLSERGELRKLGNDLVLVVDTHDRIERVRTLFQQLTPANSAAMSSGTHESEPTTQLTGAQATHRQRYRLLFTAVHRGVRDGRVADDGTGRRRRDRGL